GLFFFFSSRRRHTRSDRDWSSDVCSSDLRARLRPQEPVELAVPLREHRRGEAVPGPGGDGDDVLTRSAEDADVRDPAGGVADERSEERRGGKGGGSGRTAEESQE